MRAHLEKAAIVLTVFADEDRLHRRLHVVVDPALAVAAEEREGALVGVEHHLLRLARIGAHEHHAAVTKPRTWATFTVVVTPPMTTISWLQSNW